MTVFISSQPGLLSSKTYRFSQPKDHTPGLQSRKLLRLLGLLNDETYRYLQLKDHMPGLQSRNVCKCGERLDLQSRNVCKRSEKLDLQNINL